MSIFPIRIMKDTICFRSWKVVQQSPSSLLPVHSNRTSPAASLPYTIPLSHPLTTSRTPQRVAEHDGQGNRNYIFTLLPVVKFKHPSLIPSFVADNFLCFLLLLCPHPRDRYTDPGEIHSFPPSCGPPTQPSHLTHLLPQCQLPIPRTT